ncbi:MAG TPA: alpha-glucosidase/alpha-galactosidase [Tepidisphaeraceae bacterium]|jgi:alpha-galactosidase|nr:alpha-glucosidase/alpha-galactosidase [Tepidisphaeraceae bacterium]
MSAISVEEERRLAPVKDKANANGHAAHTQAAEQTQGLPGKFNRAIKVTMLGAGSGFTPRLVSDLLHMPGAERGHVVLVDIDRDRLSTMHQVLERLIRQEEKTGWTISSTVDRTEALPGSHYIVNCIEVSGVDCVKWDNDIPLKYGIDQCIGDTIGPGGLFKALRTVPVFLDICRDVERLCPGAIILNYTNPMNILCLAAGRAVPKVDVVGLCHSVQHTGHVLAKRAGIAYDEMTWECAGINHLAWYTTLEHDGQNLYPRLMEMARQEMASGVVAEHEKDRPDWIRKDMMLQFGAFITESSGHLSEYLPYYRKNADALKKYAGPGYCGGSRFYASGWPTWRTTADEGRMKMVRGESPVGWPRSWEYASWIIEGREKDAPVRIHGNVMNNDGTGRGQLITNLPADGCVEVACLVDRNGIHPTRYGALPAQMAAVCDSNMRMFDLAATACIERGVEAAVHALMLDPLTQAVCTPQQIRDMALEMFEAEKEFLPGYR